MENFGTWLPSSTITQSFINIQTKVPFSWVLDFFISHSHHLHSTTGIYSCDHTPGLVIRWKHTWWNPKVKQTNQPPILPTHLIFPPNEDFESLDPSVFFLSIISPPSSLLFPSVHKTQFITSIAFALFFFLIKLTGTFPIQQLAWIGTSEYC